jgi:GMP synthase (glutamine-hydrolysing)
MAQVIAAADLDAERFIREKVDEIKAAVGPRTAINALSGGLDSSTVTMLGIRALGMQLRTVFIENGLMREGESGRVAALFRSLGVAVDVVDARGDFFAALEGISDPEGKREAVRRIYYERVLGRIMAASGAKHLLQGTIFTDVGETLDAAERQRDLVGRLGVDPRHASSYKVIEPLTRLDKGGVRKVAKALGLPPEILSRVPFPRTALGARVIGEATPDRIETVRKATAIVERILADVPALHCLAILDEDRVTGMRNGKRELGSRIEIRCRDGANESQAAVTKPLLETLDKIAAQIVRDVPGVVSVTYDIAPKPPPAIDTG